MRNGAIVSLVQRNFEVNISLLCTKPFQDTNFYEPFVYVLISAQTWFYYKIASRLWFLCSCSAKNYINWSSKNGWIRVLDLHLKCKYTVEPSLTATSFPVHRGQPKTWSIHEVKTTNRSRRTGNKFEKINVVFLCSRQAPQYLKIGIQFTS